MNNQYKGSAAGSSFSLLNGRVHLEKDFILENAYLAPNDALIVGGSLIEGIGNINSDVDVYVLTDRLRTAKDIDLGQHFRAFDRDRKILDQDRPDQEVYLIHTVIPGTRIKVDIEYRTWADVHALSDHVINMFETATRSLISLTTSMNRRDLSFIHRLHNSTVLLRNPTLTSLQRRLDPSLIQYLLYRWKVSNYSVLLDMIGAWDDADWVRCADMARENMVSQFHAHTHLLGNTNNSRKWVITYARQYGVSQPLLNRYLDLLTAESGRASWTAKSFIHATLDFVDKLYQANAQYIGSNPSYPSGQLALSSIDTFFRSQDGDYSEDEITYCKKAYGIAAQPTKAWFV